MTISKTLKKFEELKTAILADDKVDFDETEVLLDFIAPYCRARNKSFMELNRLLITSREDGKITKEESEDLISSINNVSEFLVREKKIETVLVWILGVGITFLLGVLIAQHFL